MVLYIRSPAQFVDFYLSTQWHFKRFQTDQFWKGIITGKWPNSADKYNLIGFCWFPYYPYYPLLFSYEFSQENSHFHSSQQFCACRTGFIFYGSKMWGAQWCRGLHCCLTATGFWVWTFLLTGTFLSCMFSPYLLEFPPTIQRHSD